MLLFVLIPFVPTWLVRPYNGARRWINLGITDLQPSELAKVVWVLALAAWFRLRWNVRSLRGLSALPFVVTAIPMGLILLEPDLGTALLFVPTLLALLAGRRGEDLPSLTILALVGGPRGLRGALHAGARIPQGASTGPHRGPASRRSRGTIDIATTSATRATGR